MHRFFSQNLHAPGESIDLPEEAVRQCFRVLRLHPPEQVALFDGSGREIIVQLTNVAARSAAGIVESLFSPERETQHRVELWVALPRQEKWEWILQKGTELGASHFQPLELAHSVARMAAQDWPKKAERWEKIILEAVEQSGRTMIPSLSAPLALHSLLAPGEPGIVLHTIPGLPRFRAVVTQRQEQFPSHPLRLLVGPEGGLEGSEFQSLLDAGWLGASLGPRTLRCETAAITACALALDILESTAVA